MLRKLIHSYSKTIFRLMEILLPAFAKKTAMHFFFTPAKGSPQKDKIKWMETAAAEKISLPLEHDKDSYFMKYSWGKGPAVLLIHGWASRGSHFAVLTRQLVEAGFKVVTFDAFAHGRSSGRQTNIMEIYKIIKQLSDDHNGFEAVVGHSFGGMAAVFSANRGVKTKKIITIGTPASMEFILNMFLKMSNFSNKVRQALIEEVRTRTGINMSDITPANLVSDLDVEGLIIHDINDKEVHFEQAKAMAANWPAAQLVLTEGLGHKRILANQSVISKIIGFIKEKEIIRTEKLMEQY